MNKITESGARLMVQTLCMRFVDASPANELEREWVARALQLQNSLGKILGVTPNHHDIEELITSFEELESVEAGTHPDLITNLARTVDNSDAVTDYLLGRIGRETSALLEHAGFGRVAA